MRTARKVFSFLLSAKIGYIVRSSQYDHLVSKDAYYATYSDIKSTLSGELVKRWVEDTDPRKHVFEDVGIVSWLENLWKSTVDEKIGGTKRIQCIDLGCGNGVLSYLLHMRGYGVAGIDLASRKTWVVLNELAPNLALTKGIIDPRNRGATIRLLQQNLTSDSELWIIGNHSDELTPWIPILAAWASYPAENLDSADLATVYRPVNFVAIPCCRHSLAGPKLATSRHLASSATASEADSLRSPRDLQYLQYIRSISETCGFAVEEDALRIPSPKNAVIVGRKRNFDLTDHEAHRSILTAIDQLIADYGGQSFEPRKGPNTTTATNTAVADVAH
ncbi:DUF1613-domain-containing protein [Ramicandelaber brevisporus]|nr:DUF1613-domain-containing protein [Ramicandelaber brevisporus]